MAFLIHRVTAISSCVVSILEVLIGTVLVVCGFINMGVFYEQSGVGLWAGFPLLIPGLLGIVVLATRHKAAATFFTLTNIVALVVCIAHGVVAYNDTEFWDKYIDHVDANRCYERIDQCICTEAQTRFLVRRCELFTFGHELFWSMLGFSCAGGLLALLGVFTGAMGAFFPGEKEDYDAPPRGTDYDNRRRYDYYVAN